MSGSEKVVLSVLILLTFLAGFASGVWCAPSPPKSFVLPLTSREVSPAKAACGDADELRFYSFAFDLQNRPDEATAKPIQLLVSCKVIQDMTASTATEFRFSVPHYEEK
jgi:hypothetical protein